MSLTRAESLEIMVLGPLGEDLGPNAHVHWTDSKTASDAAYDEWWSAAREVIQVINPFTLIDHYSEVRLTYRAQFCRNQWKPADPYRSAGGYRPRDLDNLIGAMKPALDAIVKAGLVEDDDASRVKFGDHSIEWVEDFTDERVTVIVEPLSGGPDVREL